MLKFVHRRNALKERKNRPFLYTSATKSAHKKMENPQKCTLQQTADGCQCVRDETQSTRSKIEALAAAAGEMRAVAIAATVCKARGQPSAPPLSKTSPPTGGFC